MATTASSSLPETTSSEYEELIRKLYQRNLFVPCKYTLENMERLHRAMNCPLFSLDTAEEAAPKTLPHVIHVAGTNGKGSVCWKIAKTLEQTTTLQGRPLRVGLFVSPHIVGFRERIQINGVPISEEDVVQWLTRLFETSESHDIPSTLFELVTELALVYFAACRVDVVVLETGLGGRLDATNILPQPTLSIVTSIGLDHTKILGSTHQEIAREKAGIFKPGCPVLLASAESSISPAVRHVLQECAREKKVSALYTAQEILTGTSNQQQQQQKDEDEDACCQEENENDFDFLNARLATAALKLLLGGDKPVMADISPPSFEMIRRGTMQRPPFRFEHLVVHDNVSVVMDMGHNPPAMQYLSHKLLATFSDAVFRLVVGFSRDKDLAACGLVLLQLLQHNAKDLGAGPHPKMLHIVQASYPRAALPSDILSATPQLASYYNAGEGTTSVTTQVQLAVAQASQHNKDPHGTCQQVVVICGTAFIMADARDALLGRQNESSTTSSSSPAGLRDSAAMRQVAGLEFKRTNNQNGAAAH